MDSLLSTQAQKLRELNFNDSVDFELSKKFATKISTFLGNEKAIAESSDENFLSDLRAKLNKQGQIVLLRSELKDFFELARKHPSAKINLFFRGIKATIHGQKAICFGSYSELENLK